MSIQNSQEVAQNFKEVQRTMKLHELKPAPGSRKEGLRVGRGIGSGNGKTSGRGHKGQNGAPAVVSVQASKVDKTRCIVAYLNADLTNPFRKEYAIVNIEELNNFAAGTEVTPELLMEQGIVKNPQSGIKILGNGEITVQLSVKANKFSQSAVEKIQAAGGKTEVI